MNGRPLPLGLIIGISSAVLVGCISTWLVMDARLRREKEAMREEMRREVPSLVKEGIKGAADDMLTKEYVEKKVDEAGKLLADPQQVDQAVHTATDAADAGVKTGTKAATGVLDVVKNNEKEIRDLGKAAGDAARVGIDALLDAAGHALQGPPPPPDKDDGKEKKGPEGSK